MRDAMRGNKAEPATPHDGPTDGSLELMTEKGCCDVLPPGLT
jgi:hypothetical protein